MVVIFTVYIFSRIFEERELSENIYNAKMSTFTVYKSVNFHYHYDFITDYQCYFYSLNVHCLYIIDIYTLIIYMILIRNFQN